MSTTAQNSSLPIAITMGDPAGVGPEILARTLAASAADQHGVLQQSGTSVGFGWDSLGFGKRRSLCRAVLTGFECH